MNKMKKVIILIINVIIIFLIAGSIVFKEKPGFEVEAATIGHACEICKWSYNQGIKPPSNVNVYVKEEKAWIMGAQGDLQPVIVRIEVW